MDVTSHLRGLYEKFTLRALQWLYMNGKMAALVNPPVVGKAA